jgi:hypothetical protein
MAKALIDVTPGEVMTSGMLPDAMNEETVIWADLNNVVIEAAGIGRPLGAKLITSVSEDITHIVQQTITGTGAGKGPRGFIAGSTAIWEYDGTAVTIVNTPFTTGGQPMLETWGDWTLATNNKDKPKVRKGPGTTFLDLGGIGADAPWLGFTKCKQLIRRQPYVLALNTDVGATEVKWCSASNIELWSPKPENSAGDFVIRDIAGEIKGGCQLGDAIAIYSDEAVTIATYVGLPYVFSFTTTLFGIGIYGPKSVCPVSRQNYGIGPQGIFVTDGYSYQLLGDDNFRKWLKRSVNEARWHEITVFHNEFTDTVEFRFPNNSGGWVALYWKLDANKFAIGDLRVNAAVEREVFKTPLIGVGKDICTLTRDVSTWVGVPFKSKAQTKWMDCGSVEYDKFIDHIFLNGQLDNVTIQVEMEDLDQTQWEVLPKQDAKRQNFILQEAHKVRVTLETDDIFHLSRLRVMGDAGSATG